MNDSERLKEIRGRREKATPGPWELASADPACAHVIGNGLDTSCLLHANRNNDAEFIAHSWSDIGFLLDRVAELEAQSFRAGQPPQWMASADALLAQAAERDNRVKELEERIREAAAGQAEKAQKVAAENLHLVEDDLARSEPGSANQSFYKGKVEATKEIIFRLKTTSPIPNYRQSLLSELHDKVKNLPKVHVLEYKKGETLIEEAEVLALLKPE